MEKKIQGVWAEHANELSEDYRKDCNVMKHNFAGPPIVKDEIRATIRNMKSGKALGLDIWLH